MHFCFVENGYPHQHGGGGGAGTFVHLFARELVKNGHRASVLTKKCEYCDFVYEDEGVIVYRWISQSNLHWYISKLPLLSFFSPSVRYLEYGANVYRHLKKIDNGLKIDFVEFSEGGDYWHQFSNKFHYTVHLHGSAYTFQSHTNQKVEKGDWIKRKLELSFIRKAKVVFSPSQAMADIVLEEASGELPKIYIMPLPVDHKIIFTQKMEKGSKRVLVCSKK